MGETDRLEVAVMGAGLIGCYVGGVLAAAGVKVRMIGRPHYIDAMRQHGLKLTDFSGRDDVVAADTLKLSLSPAAAAGSDFVLVTVKSDATADAGRQLEPFITPGTTVLSLQNGIDNAAILRAALPQGKRRCCWSSTKP